MPPEFTFPADRIDYWMPLSTMGPDAIGRQRGSRFMDVIGRLAPGVTPAQAHDEPAAVARRIAEREPDARGWSDVTVLPGLTLVSVLLAVNVLGDTLRDALDPRLNPR